MRRDVSRNPVGRVTAIHLRISIRALAMVGDSITTDHISPAGSIPAASPAGKWLIAQGVKTVDFNSYGARRGNHEPAAKHGKRSLAPDVTIVRERERAGGARDPELGRHAV